MDADDVRCWVGSHAGRLFDDYPEALKFPGDAAPADGPDAYPETRAAAARLCSSLAASLRDDVEADQVRLFVNATGGVPAPPYASWYLDGRLCGPSTAWVERAYARQCLEPAGAGHPSDYVAAELDFLHFLCRHQMAARLTGDLGALESSRRAEAEFVLDHFAVWIPRFVSAIRAASPGPVYAATAGLLEAFCREEERRLGDAGPARTGSAESTVPPMGPKL